MSAVDLPGQWADSIGDCRRAGGRQASAALRRPHRLVLRARRVHGKTDLAAAARPARSRPVECAARCARRRGVHPRCVVGGVAFAESRNIPAARFAAASSRCASRDGSEVWKTYTVPTEAQPTGKTSVGTPTLGPSGVGVWGSPTLDLKRRTAVCHHRQQLLVARRRRPATRSWRSISTPAASSGRSRCCRATSTTRRARRRRKEPTCPEGSGPDYDFGSPAILVSTTGGRELLLAGQKSGVVWAVDPDKNGEVMWETRVGQGGINGGVQWGMASDGEHVYAAVVRRGGDEDGHRAHSRSQGRRGTQRAPDRRRQHGVARRAGAVHGPAELQSGSIGCVDRDSRRGVLRIARRTPARVLDA